MGGILRGDMLDTSIPERQHVNAIEKMLTRSEEDRRDGDVHLVDQPFAQVLPNRGYAASDPDILPGRGFDGPIKCLVNPVGDEVERRPPFMVMDARGGESTQKRACGTGGVSPPAFHESSGQAPRTGPNMFRPGSTLLC